MARLRTILWAGILPAFAIGVASWGIWGSWGFSSQSFYQDEDRIVFEPEVNEQQPEQDKPSEVPKETDTDKKVDVPVVVEEDDPITGDKFSISLTNSKHKVFDQDTNVETIQNILLNRMFPNYQTGYKYEADSLFKGSPEINLQGKFMTNPEGKKIFVIQREGKPEVLESYKKACLSALDKPQTKKTGDELEKLKEWCTVPTVKDVLKRHGLSIMVSSRYLGQVIDSEWFNTNSPYFDKQKFFTREELKDKSRSRKIHLLRKRCTSKLDKPFVRKLFPTTTDFLNSMNSNEEVDEFQEALLFCTNPIKASDYVTFAMNGTIASSLDHIDKDDYCRVPGQDDIRYYKNITTLDPMEGKTFWCAVRLIYGQYDPLSKSKTL